MSVRRCPLLIAHRGDRSRAPENTVSAVRMALEARPDLIEVDVRLSSDGHPVVIHDQELDRTTSGVGDVSAHTLAELRALDAGGWFAPEFAGEPLPTLQEMWEATAGRTRLAVELKGEGTGGPTGRWARELDSPVASFLSFMPHELRALKAEFPGAELRLLGAEPLGEHPAREAFLSVAEELGCVGVSVLGSLCPREALAIIHGRGLEVWVWTLNDPSEWETFVQAGADALTTDRPLELDRFLVASGLRPPRTD